MKPVKNPADYDGTQSLRDYLKHFERCSVVNGWSKEEAAVFLAASLRGEAQKVLNGLSDTDCRDYKKIVDILELRFGVEKQRELHQTRLHSRRQQENESVQALAADIRSMSYLAYIRICLQTLKKDLPSSNSLMPSKIKTTGSDYAEINHAPWMKPCRWLVTLKHFVSWMGIGEKLSEGSLVYLKLRWRCYVLTFNRNNNIRRLSKMLFSN